MAARWLRWPCVVAVTALSLAACSDGDGEDRTAAPQAPASSAPTTEAEEAEEAQGALGAPALQAPPIDTSIYDDALAATPDAIARSLNAVGVANFTGEGVYRIAENLCIYGYDPMLAIVPIAARSRFVGVLTVEPATRLFYLSWDICTVAPTPFEQVNYLTEIRETWGAPDLSEFLEPEPSPFGQAVCDVLGNEAGGFLVENGLTVLASAVSRGRVDIEDFAGLAVDAAGETCPQWMPELESALGGLG